MLAMVDYVEEMTSKKYGKYGDYGPFEHLLLLFVVCLVLSLYHVRCNALFSRSL